MLKAANRKLRFSRPMTNDITRKESQYCVMRKRETNKLKRKKMLLLFLEQNVSLAPSFPIDCQPFFLARRKVQKLVFSAKILSL